MKRGMYWLSVILVFFVLVFAYYESQSNRLSGNSIIFNLNQGNFNNGYFNNTFYNSTGGYVQLNASQSMGNYTSQVLSAGIAKWNNISWVSNVGELPNNGNSQNTPSPGINMSGNVLLMHMNDQSGSIIDSSGLGNNGAIHGGVTYNSPGKLNSSLLFSSSGSGYVSIPPNPSINMININNSGLSISAWIFMNSFGDNTKGRIVDKSDGISWFSGSGYSFWVSNVNDSPDQIVFYGGYKALSANVKYKNGHTAVAYTYANSIDIGKWIFVTMVLNDSTRLIDIYINGTLSTNPSSQTLYSPAGPSDIPGDDSAINLSVGALGLGNARWFDGRIDEVAIWNRTLSASEIKSLYQRGVNHLNLSVRSCTQSDCSDSAFTNIGEINSPYTLNLINNGNFQYNFGFRTDDLSFSPQLYNVSIDYTSTTPNLTLSSPINNTNYSINLIGLNVSSTSNNIFNWFYSFNGTKNPTIWAIGSSTTAGDPYYNPTTAANSTNPVNNSYEYWLDYYMNSNLSAVDGNNISIYNKGAGGSICSQWDARFNSDIGNNSVVILQSCGRNDFTAGSNYTDIEPTMISMYNKSKAKNDTLVIFEVHPTRDDGAACGNMTAINSWLHSYFAGNQNVTIVSLDSSFTNGNPCFGNASLYNDNLHFNIDGFKKLTSYIWSQGFNKQVFSQNKNVTFTPNITLRFPEGNNNLNVYVNDTLGNINSTSITFFVDSFPPSIVFSTSSDQNRTTLMRNKIYINITASDSGIGIKNVTLNLYNSTGLKNTTTLTVSPFTITFNNLSNGNYSVNGTIYDIFGNYNNTETRFININVIPNNISSEGNSGEWWMFMRWLNHTNWDGQSYPTIHGLNLEMYQTTGEVRSTPAVANGYVYVGSYDGKLYQLNATNVSKYITNFSSGEAIQSSPAVANGYVYVGSYDGKLYQLDATNISKQIANYSAWLSVYSSPAIANGYLYFGGEDNNIYQLNATNISKQIANYSTGNKVDSSPAIAGGFMYIGSSDSNLYQLDATNISKQIANFSTFGAVKSSPAIANGSLYIGSEDGNLYQLDATNISKQIASFLTGLYVDSSPAIANGYVYVGSLDGYVYQLNATNISKQIANYSTGGQIESSPSISNGYLYIGSGDGYVYQLNATNISKQIANYSTENNIKSSPALANGYVYIGNANGYVYQLNATNISLGNIQTDNILPTITIISPLNQSYNTNNITVNFTASDNNLVDKTWWYNGTVNLTYTVVTSYNVSQGSNTIIFYANDTFGNINSSNVTFFVDSISPMVTLLITNNTVQYGFGNESITWNSTDLHLSNSLFNITYPNGSLLASSTLFNGSIILSSPINLSLTGTYNISLLANDTLGNTNTTRTSFFVNGTSSPVITLISPSNNSDSTDTSSTFSFNIIDVSATNCSLFLDGNLSNFNSSVNIAGGINSFVNSTPLGNHNWSISCDDILGNSADSPTFVFTISTAPVNTGSPGGSSPGGSSNIPRNNSTNSSLNNINYSSNNGASNNLGNQDNQTNQSVGFIENPSNTSGASLIWYIIIIILIILIITIGVVVVIIWKKKDNIN